MFVCLYRASVGLINHLIITIKKDKEKYFSEKNCSSEGALRATGVGLRHLINICCGL